MQKKTLDAIAEELHTVLDYKPYKNFGNVPYIFNTAILFESVDDMGQKIIITKPELFPKSCNKRTVLDHVTANSINLGTIKRINWQQLNDDCFTVADIETTGLSPDYGAKIIEIGAVKIKSDGTIVDEFSSFINPNMKLSKKTRELTGITQDQVDNAPSMFEVLTKFWEFMRGTTAVFHNSAFDWDRFLLPNWKRVGVVVSELYPCIDTLQIFREMHPELKKHGLEELCNLYGVPVENHHRAINDAHMTAKAFVKMREEYSKNFENLPKTKWVQAKKQTHNISVSRVSFWGAYKKKSGVPIKERQYVNFTIDGCKCSAFYEILEDSWVIQNCPISFDVLDLQEEVLKFLELKTVDELKNFRN